MRVLLCMAQGCPWSNSIAASLAGMGHEVHAFDFAHVKAGGFVSTRSEAVAGDLAEYRRAIASLRLQPSMVTGDLRYVLAAPGFRRYVRRLQPDVVVALGGGGYGLMIYLSGIRPYVSYVVGSEVLLASPLKRRLNRLVLGAAAGVLANGEYLAAKAREQAPGADVRSLLIGVDVEKFPLARFDRRPVQLVCNRGFAPVYNNEAIVRALARLGTDVPDFRMVFVSGGVGLPAAVALADRLLPAPVRARVTFLGGVPYQQVVRTLAESQLFLSMSRSDGTATALLEAMACGLFPIVSDIPQNRPLVDGQGGRGVLVPLDDDDALARAIGASLRDIESCGRWAADNRRVVEQVADAGRNRRMLADHLARAAQARR